MGRPTPAETPMGPAAPDLPVIDQYHLPKVYSGRLQPNHWCRAWNASREKYCKARAGWGTDHLGEGRCRTHAGGDHLTRIKHGFQRRYGIKKSPRIQALLDEYAADPDPLNLLPELALARALLVDFIERYEENASALKAWHESYRASGRMPMDPQQLQALHTVLDEFQTVAEGQGGLTPLQAEELSDARALAARLGEVSPAKPHQVMDIAEAVPLAESVTKIVERIETIRAKNAITYEQLKQFLWGVDRCLELRLRQILPTREAADEAIAQLRQDFISITL